jgi:ABC-type ATPase involved in cell division
MDQVDRLGAALLLVTHDEALADAVTRRRVPLGLEESAAAEVTTSPRQGGATSY